MMKTIRFLIGVDGGGTSCRAAVATIDGALVGRGHAGASNITTDLSGARENIMTAIHAALSDAGLPKESVAESVAYLGLAGAATGDFATELSTSLPFAQHEISSDVTIALEGALGDSDGAIAILGTGSAFMSRKGGRMRLIGGWGFQLSDLGGGARLGRQALETTLLAHDEVIPHSALTLHILAQFDNAPNEMVLFAKNAKPVDYGRYAPLVMQYLDESDANAITLMQQAGQTIDLAFDALNLGPNDQIALLGGLAKFYPPYLAPRHQKRLVEPKADALTGALKLAKRLANRMQDAGGQES